MFILSGGIYKYSKQLTIQAKQLPRRKRKRACKSSLCSILFVVKQKSFLFDCHAHVRLTSST